MDLVPYIKLLTDLREVEVSKTTQTRAEDGGGSSDRPRAIKLRTDLREVVRLGKSTQVMKNILRCGGGGCGGGGK